MMNANAFYNDWDTELIGAERPDDYRTPFQIDRDRVIHSTAFRKLQSKTQVYLSGEYDFYRTRLTHSIEVAQIGRSICSFLRADCDALDGGCFIDADLVEACCLSHDLGHPPFGHGGERTLHRLFRDSGGFEGNAQTLRLIAETLYQDNTSQRGMAPTRAFVDGIMKYKSLYSECDHPDNHFLYDEQLRYRDFVNNQCAALVGEQAAGAFDHLSSIECQIMDWSDDTAYCINDIVDGVRAGFITVERLERWAARQGLDATEQDLFEGLLNDIRRNRLEAIFSRKIGQFIHACRLVEIENELSTFSNRYRFKLKIDSSARNQARFFKRVALDLIFRSAPLQQMDFKGDRVLEAIWKAIDGECFRSEGASKRILPESVFELISVARSDRAQQRVVCDYLAGLTDGQARRVYKRLFDPEYGSIVDLD